jgi:hypothetical protein
VRERTAIARKIANLVEAISDGRSSSAILARLEALEAQKNKFEGDPLATAHAAPALHPGIAKVYAAKVCDLTRSYLPLSRAKRRVSWGFHGNPSALLACK